ncbi:MULTISPECIES: 4'-phosphopantetheinyl transferase family protein [Kitasatospora]|uniref:4'-phosphopantetheinyl transferase superfamily protein n=1 Tax=Kitasatospora cystarginea TaxID=58350 RepID=A0ABP5RBB8_9ACTN
MTAVERPVAPADFTSGGPVHIWHCALPRAVGPVHLSLLTADERQRAARLRTAAKSAQFVATRVAVRLVLADLLATPPLAVRLGRRPCPGCGDPGHGPPVVAHPRNSLWISISHTSGCGLLAVAADPVGVDVERYGGVDAELLAPEVLTPAERAHIDALPDPAQRDRAFLRCWTRKEAVLKGAGVGMAADLRVFDVHPGRAGDGTAVEVTGRVPGIRTRWEVRDLPLGPAWAAALARPAGLSGPVHLHTLTWPSWAP